MKRQYINKLKLPDKPGVYVFCDTQKRPLYIGRATSLRDRVKSYFSADLIETRGPRIVDMVTRSVSLKWTETDSVLEAIILESAQIKKYQPRYNVDERDDKSDQYVVITDELWPRVFTMRVRDYEKAPTNIKVKKIFGPYIHGGLINEALKIIRKIFPFKDKKSHDPRHESFYRAIGKSPDGDDINARRRYGRTIDNLVLFFEGKKKTVRTRLERDMKASAKDMKFEEAGLIKRTLYALDHVNDIALIKSEKEDTAKFTANDNGVNAKGHGFRMEAFDIAHLSGTNVVGAMTVSVNGVFEKSEYKKFKISRDTNNDVANLVELLSRRLNHSEWTFPDLIIVDGNEMQLKAALAVLSARRINIPVVGVTKDEHHKARNIIGSGEFASKYEREIIALNAEVHRFALAYHRKRRTM